MTATDALTLAKAHPDTVAKVLTTVAAAVQANPALVGDIITAIETRNYAGFALSHLGLIVQLVGLVGSNQTLVDALGAVTK